MFFGLPHEKALGVAILVAGIAGITAGWTAAMAIVASATIMAPAGVVLIVAVVALVVMTSTAILVTKELDLKKSFTIPATIATGIITFFLLSQQLFIFK